MDPSGRIRSYRDLVVWRKAVELVCDVYRLTDVFPPSERFGLTAQLRRSAVSVPSNVAEGPGRRCLGDFARHVSIARGSLMEMEAQLFIAARLGYVTPDRAQPMHVCVDEVSRLLSGLLASLRRRQQP